MLAIASVLFLVSYVAAGEHKLIFRNNCPFDVWASALGKTMIKNGGWQMGRGQQMDVMVPHNWQGRFWGRTGCQQQGNQFVCETGDCGRRRECNGAGGEPPATLAEFQFDAFGGLDYFDVSLVDGYNLPMAINPMPGTTVPGKGLCQRCGCNRDLNAMCPNELRKVINGRTVACKSACAGKNTDQYCCRGPYDCSPHGQCRPGTQPCDPKRWPVNYAQIFKSACPTSYSYAYDDPSSTFTCGGNPSANYEIIFCP